jgi:hypothetical protein
MQNLMKRCWMRVFRKHERIIFCEQYDRTSDTAVIIGGCTCVEWCMHATVNIVSMIVFSSYEFRLWIKFHFCHVSWQINKLRNVKTVWSNNKNKNVEKINTLKYSDTRSRGFEAYRLFANPGYHKKDTNIAETVP